MTEPRRTETIALPRSGVVLTLTEYGTFENDAARLLYRENPPFYAATFQGRIHADASRDEAIAWLDSRVLALRAALMPADARERVVKALIATIYGGGSPSDCDRSDIEEFADAILTTLGGGER